MTEKEIKLSNKCSNLEAENEKLKIQLKNYEENVVRIITNFWCWYVSSNHIRDLSAKEEGEKYANNFFHDLIQEANEGLDLDKTADEVEEDLQGHCTDALCEGCTEEDCTARKLGFIC